MSKWPSHYYILVDRVPIAVDFLTWARWFQYIENRRMARTDISDRCHVSTVFLGLDHNFSGGEPLLFETMVFGGPINGEIARYCTYAEAERGHADMAVQAQKAVAQIDAMMPRAADGHS